MSDIGDTLESFRADPKVAGRPIDGEDAVHRAVRDRGLRS